MNINISKLFSLIVVFLILIFASIQLREVYFLSWVGIFFFIKLLFDFYNDLGKMINIRSLMLLIAFLQWMIAPFFAYHFFPDSQFYYMQVAEEEYMSYIVPAILAFYFGLSLKMKSSNSNVEALYIKGGNDSTLLKRGYFLYFIGVTSLLLLSVIPSSLSFAFFLLSKLHFVGAYYLLAAKAPYKYIWFAGAFVPVVLNAGESSVFHDLLLWGGFSFMVYAFLHQIGTLKKTLLLCLGVLFIMFIQFIKADYREGLGTSSIASGGKGSGAELALEVADQKFSQEGLSDDYFQGLVDRLNQGWIIARIIYVVPDFEPFAEGETINDGIVASLVPRFLNPDKVKSGGANFERFTGMVLEGTSMNIGVVGEAYANYGVNGGIFFMLIFGFFFNIALSILKKYAYANYEVYLWIPFLFLYVVKAEDDFATLFNQFTKAVLVSYFIFWLMKRFYPRITDVKVEAVS